MFFFQKINIKKELEDPLEEGEEVYEDDEFRALRAADDKDVEEMDAVQAKSLEPVIVSIVDGDAPEDIREATVGARRLAALKRLRAEALAENLNVPRAIFCFDQEISQLERGIRSRTFGEKSINEVLRRSVEEKRAHEHEMVMKARERARRRARQARKDKRDARRKAKAKAKVAKEKAARMRRLAALPLRFTKADLGAGQKGCKNRCKLLERICLNAPKLPEAEAAQWPDLCSRYARLFQTMHPVDTGGRFLRDMLQLQQQLAEHYKARTPFNGPGHAKGDPGAFLAFVRGIIRAMPADAGVIMA